MKVRDYTTGGGYLRGLDVSSYQGTINFAKVKSNNIKFVILRAYGSSHGSGGDTRIKEYADGFKSVGIPCGSYFFCMIPSNGNLDSARHQANLYANKLESVFGAGSWGQLTPFLDLEGNENVGGVHSSMNSTIMVNWVKEFRNTFESRFNNRVKLGIYSSWSFIKDHNNFNNGELKTMPLWIAKWRTSSIADVGGWTNWVAWQYTDNAIPFSSGQSVGVSSTGLDMNYAESLDDLMFEEPITASTPTATLNQNNSIFVKWTKPSLTSVTKVELFRNGTLIATLSKTADSYMDVATAYGTYYSYNIIVYTSYDKKQSLTSNEVKTIIPRASIPTGLSVEVFDRKLNLSWNPNPVDDDVTGYTIYRDNVKIDLTDKTYYTFLGLENGRIYNFQVQAHNRNPVPSDKSPIVTGTPVTEYPNPPISLATTIKANKEIILTWNHIPKENFSHFKIIVDDKIIIDNVKNTFHNFTGLAVNIEHTFKIISYDIQGDSTESSIKTATLYEPAKVSNLRGTPKDRSIILEWDSINFFYTDEDETTQDVTLKNYLIYESDNLIGSVNGQTTSYAVENLENNKTYQFTVQAISNQDLRGSLSNPLNIMPIIDYPNKATNLQAEILDRTTILFKWEHIETDNFSHYDVYINGQPVEINTINKEHRYEGAIPNFNYELEIVSFDDDGDSVSSGKIIQKIDIPSVPLNLNAHAKDREVILSWKLNEENFVKQYNIYLNDVLHSVVNSPNETIKINGLINEVNYSFQIQAVGENSFSSELSNPVFAKTKLDIPKKPKITMHKELGNGGVELFWDHDQKEYHSHYNVYKNGFLYAQNIKTKSFQTDYLESNKTHSFQVEAFDIQSDRSGFSNSRFVTIYAKIIEPLSVLIGKIDENIKVIKPILYLCKPNKETIGKLTEAYNITYSSRYADLNEITFNIPMTIDNNHELEKNKHFDDLKERFLIRLELGTHLEYFIVNEIQQSSDTNSKTIHGWSLGYELKDKLITNFKEEIYTAHSAFQIALDKVMNWQIGANIKNEDFYWNQERRIFNVSNQTILDFIISIATSFNAVLIWDTVNRIIDFANPTIEDENKGLKIKYGKYLKSLSKTSSIEEMVTHLKPIGENNLTIREVTLNGSDYLEDFSYFLNGFEEIDGEVISHSPYMSDELCRTIISYHQLLNENDGIFRGFLDNKKIKNEELVELLYELDDRETNLFIIQDLLDSLKAEGDLFFESTIYAGVPRNLKWKINKDYKYILMAKTDNVEGISIQTSKGTKTFINEDWTLLEKISFNRTNETTVESSIDEYDYLLSILGTTSANIEFQINRILISEYDLTDNEDQLLPKYNEYLIQKIYDEQKILVDEKNMEIENINTDIENLQNLLSIYNNFTPSLLKERDLFVITKEYIDEKIANPEELKNRALEKFKELKNPIVTIVIDIVNLLEVLEEHNNWHKLEIGSLINVFYDKFNLSIEAKILQMDFDFNNNTVSLTISNVKDIQTNQEKFIKALYGAINTSTTVSIEKNNWAKALEVKEQFDSFINREFDATKQKIIAGTNETVEISRRGLLIKSDVDPNSFLVANASVLAITNDGGKSYKNAITTTGIIGERIIGKILAGENLIIENSAGTFRVDGDGVTISNQALKIVGGITQDLLSDNIDFQTDLSGITGVYIDNNKENIDISAIPISPTLSSSVGNVIEYTNVTTDMINLSLDWSFEDDGTNASNIDGFMIYLYTSQSSALYNFGNNPKNELSFHVKPDKRSIIFYNVPKNLYYSFAIESYRVVNTTINPSGVLKSERIQVTTPFKPSDFTSYVGDIIGTINYGKEVKVKPEILSAIRIGQSYDNVTIDTINGLQAESNDNDQRTIINSNGFRIQTNDGTGYKDKLWATSTGLVADDLTTNRLIVNDGTGNVLINALTKQINFNNFEVITGKIYANDNVQMRGLEIVNDSNVKTLEIDLSGNVKISGNITMTNGSISWGNVATPDYEAIGGVKPPSTANNTLNELMNNQNIKGFYNVNGELYLYASYITGGILNADLIQTGSIDANIVRVKNLNADEITTGTFSFNRASGGALKLGGAKIGEELDEDLGTVVRNIYENGRLIVLDTQGIEVVTLSGDLAGFDKLFVGEITGNNVVTFNKNIDTTNYYVDPIDGNDDNTGTSANPFKTIQKAIDIIPMVNHGQIYIRVTKTNITWNESLVFDGILGAGRIGIGLGRRNKINGNVLIRTCVNEVHISTEQGTTVSTSATSTERAEIIGQTNSIGSAVIYSFNNSLMNIYDLKISGNNIADYGFNGYCGVTRATYVEIYNCKSYACIFQACARGDIGNCAGSNPRGIRIAHGTLVGGSGTGFFSEIAGQEKVIDQGGICNVTWSYNAGSKTPTYPTVTVSSFNANDTHSYTTNTGWSSDYIYQGKRSTDIPIWYGVMFFNTADFTVLKNGAVNRTITKVRLLLQRTSTLGENTARNPKVYYNLQTSASGGISALQGGYLSSTGYLWGESKWLDLPVSYGQAFQNGTAKSLVLYIGSDTAQYCRFEAKATLEITHS